MQEHIAKASELARAAGVDTDRGQRDGPTGRMAGYGMAAMLAATTDQCSCRACVALRKQASLLTDLTLADDSDVAPAATVAADADPGAAAAPGAEDAPGPHTPPPADS